MISAGLAFHFNELYVSTDNINLIKYCHKLKLPCFKNASLEIFIQMVSSEITPTLWKGFECSFIYMYLLLFFLIMFVFRTVIVQKIRISLCMFFAFLRKRGRFLEGKKKKEKTGEKKGIKMDVKSSLF